MQRWSRSKGQNVPEAEPHIEPQARSQGQQTETEGEELTAINYKLCSASGTDS